MTQLLIFGADSMVGSHFVATTRNPCRAAGRKDPRDLDLPVAGFERIDLSQPENAARLTREAREDVVVNFAGATDVDKVEQERPTGAPDSPSGPAFRVNTLAPEAMAQSTRAAGKFLITISTDFVFDGRAGPYSETSGPDPFSPQISWYGWTKGEGERRVLRADPTAPVVRIAYPYRIVFPPKSDFARRILDQYRSHTLPPLFTDQEITPTWVPDVSRAIEYLIASRERGTFHVASPEVTSPYRFGRELVRAVFGSVPEVTEGSMEDFLRRPGVTPRPRQGGLLCRRLPSAGVPLTSWQEGLRQVAAGIKGVP